MQTLFHKPLHLCQTHGTQIFSQRVLVGESGEEWERPTVISLHEYPGEVEGAAVAELL